MKKKTTLILALAATGLATMTMAASKFGIEGNAVTSVVEKVELVESQEQLTEAQFKGSGTEEDPFLISNADELLILQSLINSGQTYKGQFIALSDDIDMSGVDFSPMGTNAANAFNGTFDGMGHSISNLTITAEADYVGLFGCTGSNAVIRNVRLNNITIKCMDYNYVGGIAGKCNGTIESCVVSSDQGIEGKDYVGGIAGSAYIVKTCKTECDGNYAGVFSFSGSAGGVVGYLTGTAENNQSSSGPASYSGDNTSGVGGIVGYACANAVVRNNINEGFVGGYSSTGTPLGGIVGIADSGAKIENNVNSEDATIFGTSAVGGIVGKSLGAKLNGNLNYSGVTACTSNGGGILGLSSGATEIKNAVNEGFVQIYNSSKRTLGPCAGGIIGIVADGNPVVANALNAGEIYGTDRVGGIIGEGGGTLSGVVNTGSLFSYGAASGEGEFVGGLIGEANLATTIDNAYNCGVLETATTSVANAVAHIASGASVTATETYFVTDFGTAADNPEGTALSMAELAALGSSNAAAASTHVLAPKNGIFDYGDRYTLPLLKALANDETARVQAAAVIVEKGDYNNCTGNLRISGMEGIQWEADVDVFLFNPQDNYAYVKKDYHDDVTITATCGKAVKEWEVRLDVISGIIEVKDLGEKKIVGVKYYSVDGQESASPFDGVNIVVTHYNDNTTRTVKIVR